MISCDEYNLQLVESQEAVDKKNKKFYGKFRYPWPPVSFESFPEKEFGITMLNQDIGCWKHDRMPDRLCSIHLCRNLRISLKLR